MKEYGLISGRDLNDLEVQNRYKVYIHRQGEDRMKLYGSYSASQIREGLEYWFAHEDEGMMIEVKAVTKSAADTAKPQ